MTIVKKRAKNTLTAVELDRGQTLYFTLQSGERWTMELLDTSAEVFSPFQMAADRSNHRVLLV